MKVPNSQQGGTNDKKQTMGRKEAQIILQNNEKDKSRTDLTLTVKYKTFIKQNKNKSKSHSLINAKQ